MLSGKGYYNEKYPILESIESEYLHGSLRERKIEAIKRIRTATNAGLKESKDLSEIWDGTLPIYGNEKVLEGFGYSTKTLAEIQEEKDEQVREKAAESWIEVVEGTYVRIDQIIFVDFHKDSINISVSGDTVIPIIDTDGPNYWTVRRQLLKLVGAPPENKKIADKDKCGRRFKID